MVRSADSKVGDFHLTVSELVNGKFYQDATFEEIIVVLENIYVSKEGCSVQSITRDLRNTTLIDNASIGTQLVRNTWQNK